MEEWVTEELVLAVLSNITSFHPSIIPAFQSFNLPSFQYSIIPGGCALQRQYFL
jgi:hypothetical protein